MSRAVPHTWTEEQEEYMKSVVTGRSRMAIREEFNKEHNLDLTLNQIVGYMKRNNLKTGLTGRFEEGRKPWNRGLEGLNTGGEKGWFKRGEEPINYRTVGSERVDSKDGYVRIKVQDGGSYQERWRHKHVVEWEKVNGKVPDNHVIAFLDTDRSNISLDNLVLLSRSELLLMSKNDLFSSDPEVTKTGLNLVKLMKKTRDLGMYEGEAENIKEHIEKAERNGINEATFTARLRRGWGLKDSISKPLHYRFKKTGGI